MSSRRSNSGLCILRIEPQESRFLVTVRTRPDIGEAAAERVFRTVDVDAAVRVVRDFLLDFAKVDSG